MKTKTVNAYVWPLKKKICPCGCKDIPVFAIGEYLSGKWRTVEHFCRGCFADITSLRRAASTPEINLVFKPKSGYSIPEWINLENLLKNKSNG